MASFKKTTDFILSHKDVVYGKGFSIETCVNGQTNFALTAEANGPSISQFNLTVTGGNQANFIVNPDDLADEIVAGRPMIPNLLAKLNAPQNLILLAQGAAYDAAELFEGFTLGDVTARVVYDPAPADPSVPAGYRLTVKVAKGNVEHFGLSAAIVGRAMRASKPVLGYAIDLNPGAAMVLAREIGKSVDGMGTAYHVDVDNDAVSSVPAAASLPPGQRLRV